MWNSAGLRWQQEVVRGGFRIYWCNFYFHIYFIPMLCGGNAMMTNSSKRCERLRMVTVPISIAFIGTPWSTNLNKNLGLEENVIFYTQKWITFENFYYIVLCCIFVRKINFQKEAALSQRIFAVYRSLKASCFIGNSACQKSYTTDGATICKDFPDALGVFRIYCYVSCISIWNYRPRSAVDCTENFCPTKHGSFVAGLLLFLFKKLVDEWNENYKIATY